MHSWNQGTAGTKDVTIHRNVIHARKTQSKGMKDATNDPAFEMLNLKSWKSAAFCGITIYMKDKAANQNTKKWNRNL